MIDWQVHVNGSYPPGWDPHRDGCWFPDEDHQEYLLPYFDVGDSPIDPYGRTEFKEAEMRRLREHLHWYRSIFDGKPEFWTMTEASSDQTKTISLEREKVLEVVDKTIEMVEVALARGWTIVFRGD